MLAHLILQERLELLHHKTQGLSLIMNLELQLRIDDMQTFQWEFNHPGVPLDKAYTISLLRMPEDLRDRFRLKWEALVEELLDMKS